MEPKDVPGEFVEIGVEVFEDQAHEHCSEEDGCPGNTRSYHEALVRESLAEILPLHEQQLRAARDALRHLLDTALNIRMYGERAPGGNENWRDWERAASALLYPEAPSSVRSALDAPHSPAEPVSPVSTPTGVHGETGEAQEG